MKFLTGSVTVSSVSDLNTWYGSYYGQGPESSPEPRIAADAPPFLIAHGDLDPQVPAADARHFADRLRATPDTARPGPSTDQAVPLKNDRGTGPAPGPGQAVRRERARASPPMTTPASPSSAATADHRRPEVKV
ncbi:hypothetical protein J2S55_008511 [Streptosporangium brasiliense]|uniref:Peptidase S9 prolyl oligopeptidase catalytic domain-containing protein n=1 Tax=Streptosporangium brasiliense TaxID=47480 RepID=A0ABT9RLM1_9ACTN|nr:hypothetical protein [Streptosporangium brasiliense]